jgi:transcriptional regulator of acetoin/glycerol metabolism
MSVMNGQTAALAEGAALRSAKPLPHTDSIHSATAYPDSLQGGGPTPIVDISWRRCANEFKLDRAREYAPTVLDSWRVKELQGELSELVRIAKAEMDALYEQISGSGYALLLADTHGVILCETVDPTMKRVFAGAGLVVGAEWSERCEGTNGIGTCAAEARPITIHQSDHFRLRHTGLSCSAAPIHDPAGRVIAVLDASCVNANGPRESQLHTIALVNSSARLIEKCLFLRCYQGEAILRFHDRAEFVDLLHDGALAVAADGRIVASDSTGLKLLGLQDRKDVVGRSIADIFDTTFVELLAANGAGARAMFELRDNRHGRLFFARWLQAGLAVAHASKVPAMASRAIVHVAPEQPTAIMSLADIAGDDPQMIANVRKARRVADCTVAVLIQGPTGSGKEAFAKALHLASKRAKQPFIALNCAAIPESLIESELFGYAPGTFTGARREGMRGRIAQSSGGTLFLDEIGDMPLMMQSRLLRVLAEQEVMPLGSETLIKVDLRVISATHRDLPDMIARGQFREDLYYRLNGITLELPPLAMRRDKEALTCKCIAHESAGGEIASIERGALELFLAYNWPGNIRELRSAIRAALAICEDRIIRVSDLPTVIRQYRPAAANPIQSRDEACGDEKESLGAAEREALLRSIEKYQGNMTRVAAQLGISRNTLYRKIKRQRIKIARCPEDD